MQKKHFLLVKKFKNTESAQLWSNGTNGNGTSEVEEI